MAAKQVKFTFGNDNICGSFLQGGNSVIRFDETLWLGIVKEVPPGERSVLIVKINHFLPGNLKIIIESLYLLSYLPNPFARAGMIQGQFLSGV